MSKLMPLNSSLRKACLTFPVFTYLTFYREPLFLQNVCHKVLVLQIFQILKNKTLFILTISLHYIYPFCFFRKNSVYQKWAHYFQINQLGQTNEPHLLATFNSDKSKRWHWNLKFFTPEEEWILSFFSPCIWHIWILLLLLIYETKFLTVALRCAFFSKYLSTEFMVVFPDSS